MNIGENFKVTPVKYSGNVKRVNGDFDINWDGIPNTVRNIAVYDETSRKGLSFKNVNRERVKSTMTLIQGIVSEPECLGFIYPKPVKEVNDNSAFLFELSLKWPVDVNGTSIKFPAGILDKYKLTAWDNEPGGWSLNGFNIQVVGENQTNVLEILAVIYHLRPGNLNPGMFVCNSTGDKYTLEQVVQMLKGSKRG